VFDSVWGKKIYSFLNRSFWIYALVIFVVVKSVNFDLMFERRSKLLLGLFFNGGYKNYNDGIVYFDYMLQKEPDNYVYYFNMGTCYLKLEHYQEAVKYYQKGMALKPGIFAFHNNLAEALKKLGRNQEAEQLLEELHKGQ